METLKFSYNWNNKLETKHFTTIRLSPRFQVGEIVGVELKGKRMNNAKCIGKQETRIYHLKEYECYLDTGYGVEQTKAILKRMYAGKDWERLPVYIYLFKSLGHKESPIDTLF